MGTEQSCLACTTSPSGESGSPSSASSNPTFLGGAPTSGPSSDHGSHDTLSSLMPSSGCVECPKDPVSECRTLCNSSNDYPLENATSAWNCADMYNSETRKVENACKDAVFNSSRLGLTQLQSVANDICKLPNDSARDVPRFCFDKYKRLADCTAAKGCNSSSPFITPMSTCRVEWGEFVECINIYSDERSHRWNA